MKFELPKTFMGVPVNEKTLEEVLGKKKEKVKRSQQPIAAPITSANIDNPENYIILPSHKHGNYSYSELLVGMNRLGYDSNVERATKELGFSVADSGEEAKGHVYIGNIHWEQALKLNLKLGNITLNPRQFIDFKELLELGMSGKGNHVYNGKGNTLSVHEIRNIYNEIFEVREPWRSEWLDAKFLKSAVSDELIINYNHRLINDDLGVYASKALKQCVMKMGWVDSDSFNVQGLPTKKSKSHKLYFWPPNEGTVARFVAGSVWAGLSCDGNLSDAASVLGVRPVRKKNLDFY